MEDLGLYTPIILGITEAIKRAGINERFAPIVAILIGILVSGITNGFDWSTLIKGIVYGLSASGLWETGKMLAGK